MEKNPMVIQKNDSVPWNPYMGLFIDTTLVYTISMFKDMWVHIFPRKKN